VFVYDKYVTSLNARVVEVEPDDIRRLESHISGDLDMSSDG
jgi:hypothetical protein